MRLLSEFDQCGHEVAERRVAWLAEGEIEFLIERVKRIVDFLFRRLGRKDAVLRANLVLSFFDGFERACGKKREDGRAEAGNAFAGNENRPAENVGVNLIEDIILLRDAAGINDPLDVHTVFGHAIENDARMEGSAFDGGKEFVLRGALQVPAESDAAQIGIDEHGAIAIVPGDAKEASLASAVFFEANGLTSGRRCPRAERWR